MQRPGVNTVNKSIYIAKRADFSKLGVHTQYVEQLFVHLMQSRQIASEITNFLQFIENNFWKFFTLNERLLVPCDFSRDSHGYFRQDVYLSPTLSSFVAQTRAFRNTLAIVNYLLPTLLRLLLIPQTGGIQNLLVVPDFDWAKTSIYFDSDGQLIQQDSFSVEPYTLMQEVYDQRHNGFFTSIPFPQNYKDRRTFARDTMTLCLNNVNRNLSDLSDPVINYLKDLDCYDEYEASTISGKTARWIEECFLEIADYCAENLKR